METKVRRACSVAALGVLLGAVGCSDAAGPELPPDTRAVPTPPSPFVVSNPRASSAVSGAGDVAYVSLSPGSIPNGTFIVVRPRSARVGVTAPMMDGGVDPMPVAAAAGDTLDIEVSAGSERLYYATVVPRAAKPVVVRTIPATKTRDVAVRLAVVAVFSEPMRESSLSASSVQLTGGSTAVGGTVSISDAAALTMTFTPNDPLEPGTEYRLSLTPGIADVDGESLAEPASVAFTTVSAATPGPRFGSVTVGTDHSCALTTDGAAYCWGSNEYNALGDGTGVNSATPVRVAGGLTFATLSAGHAFTCGLTTGGDAYCWGNQLYGQLGDGTQSGRSQPTPVSGGHKFAMVTTGAFHACGLTVAGAAFCWGASFYGALGVGEGWADAGCGVGQRVFCSRPAPVAGGLVFATLAAGEWTTCGVTTSARAYCWGFNGSGDLGVGNNDGPERCGPADDLDPPWTACSSTPVPVAGDLTFQAGAEQFALGCGLAPNGAAYCWGDNNQFRLGPWREDLQQCQYASRPSYPFSCATTPIQVVSGLTFKSIYSGPTYSCGLTPDGAAVCWGVNRSGELGTGTLGPETCRIGNSTFACSTRPVPVGGGYHFVSLAINEGGYWSGHSCGVSEAGDVYCWGSNEYGELGNGTKSRSYSPIRIAVVQ